ncbi:MAG: hypothetical protein D6739_02955 [Nitrospirae bacterium]|nr:MAG: hypothetical protein D6739_02955 [Nitrospirota bacterium]
MRGALRRASLGYAAGSLGGLVNSLAVVAAGRLGVSAALGVAIHPALTPPWLYPRLVWGGLFGLLLALPLRLGPVSRALLVSLVPTAVQLLVVFPLLAGKGVLGLELGAATPLFVLAANAVWGLAAVAWLRVLRAD